MKKIVLVISLVVIASLFAMAVPHPAVVVKFYETMKDLCNASDESKAVAYRNDLMDCFLGRELSGIWVPNDFDIWGFENEKMISANTYSTRFYQLAYKQKKIWISDCYIQNSQPISEVELKEFKNKSSSELIQTIVKKKLSDGKTTKAFSDTLIVKNGKIEVFRNTLYNGEDIVDLEALRALAASYYSLGQYYKAYQTYEDIIKLDPKNSNAYYRLAILTHYGKGCEQNNNKAIAYAEKAKSLRYTDETKRLVYYLKSRQRI